MDFSAVVLTEAQQKFRDEVRAFLDEHLTEEVYAGARELTDHFDLGLWLALGAKGWLEPRWKKEDGGAELDDVCVRILETELRKRDAPVAGGANGLIWPAVDAYGVPDLREELKPQVANGNARFVLGYSEPDGGSDIANAKTRAERDGDEWIINGSKIFTTSAQNGTHVFLITRTDPTLPKHKGLTMFLVPMDTPGIEVQALPTVGDERTNLTYYSDVHISDRYRLGEVNNGWSVLHGPLDAEHSIGDEVSKLDDLSIGVGHMRYMLTAVEAATRWAKDAPDGNGPMIDDRSFLNGLGRMLVEIEAAVATPGPMGRIKGADVAIANCERLIDLVGPEAVLPYGADGTIANGAIDAAHRAVQVTATYGGTTEVFRTIIAQHHLGLPRPDYPGRKAFLTGDRPVTVAA
jgi:alkylation response protein AidB-like acyl-CoA dehydrogenase